MTNSFYRLRSLFIVLSILGMTACSHAPLQANTETNENNVVDDSSSTILLVSLDDGSIIRQTLDLDADICVKALDDPKTMCYSQGEAIVNNNGVVVGYEMLAQTISLKGRN